MLPYQLARLPCVFLSRSAMAQLQLRSSPSEESHEPFLVLLDTELDCVASDLLSESSEFTVHRMLTRLGVAPNPPLQFLGLAHWILETTVARHRRQRLDCSAVPGLAPAPDSESYVENDFTLVQRSNTFSNYLRSAIDFGFYDVVQTLLLSNNGSSSPRLANPEAVDRAAKSNSFSAYDIIKLLVEFHGFSVPPKSLYRAANTGNLKIYKLLESYLLPNLFTENHRVALFLPDEEREPAELARWILIDAAVKGHLDLLSHLYSQKHIYGFRDHYDGQIQQRSTFQYAMELACQEGKLDCVRFLAGKGLWVSDTAVCGAAQKGHLETIKFLWNKRGRAEWTLEVM